MITILGCDDLRRDRRVVAVAFHQPLRTNGLFHAALRPLRARELRNQRDPHAELGAFVFQRLHPVVADDFPLAVCRAEPHVSGNRRFDFITRQVSRQLFVPRLVAVFLAARVALHFNPRLSPGLQDRFRQACRRVNRFRGVAEVETQLARILEIPFAAFLKRPSQQFGHFQLQRFNLLLQGSDLLLALGDGLRQLGNQRLATGHGVGNVQFDSHARQHNYCGSRARPQIAHFLKKCSK